MLKDKNKTNKNNSILISYIIPSYNCAKTIKNTLNSFDYNYDNFEVLVIDDGSTIPFKKEIEPFMKLYPDIIKYYHKGNGNWGSVVNYVIKKKLANGYWIKILDSDDELLKHNIPEYMMILSKNHVQKCDIIATSHIMYFSKDKRIEKKKFPTSSFFFKITSFSKFRAPNGVITHHQLTISRELFYQLGQIPEKSPYMDSYLIYQILLKSHKLFICRSNLYMYKYIIGSSNQSVSVNNFVKNINNLFMLIEKILKINIDMKDISKKRYHVLLSHIKRMIYMIALVIMVDTSNDYIKNINLGILTNIVMKNFSNNKQDCVEFFRSNPILSSIYNKNIFFLRVIFCTTYKYVNYGMFKALKTAIS